MVWGDIAEISGLIALIWLLAEVLARIGEWLMLGWAEMLDEAFGRADAEVWGDKVPPLPDEVQQLRERGL
ncbi:MAG: hypothetical protein M3Q08_00995 [Pseudomonadota bacterium]|nr:hypothetical protein [Pseudomonadota bacterium]